MSSRLNVSSRKEAKDRSKNAPTCIDLFSGAGGLSLGFCQAGGIPLAAVDNDPASVATYRNMFPRCSEVFEGKIEDWHPKTRLANLDVMIGGPPCQGFSPARGFRFVEDPRNQLYKQFVRLVDSFRPKWIVMENVPGITNIGGGTILQQIYDDFHQIGYWLDSRVINMAEYGVPQTRKRAIFVGTRTARRFVWPAPTHTANKPQLDLLKSSVQPFVSVGDAISDLPWPLGKYFAHRANSQMRGPRNRLLHHAPAFTLRVRGDEFAICESPAERAFSPGPLPDVEFSYRPAANAFQDMMRESSPAWLPDFAPHPVVDRPAHSLRGTRRLAIREQARLQTFPDWFSFSGTAYAQGRQIGNAVPPLFAKQLFAALFRALV